MKKLKLNLLLIAALVIGTVTMAFEMSGTATTFHYASESTAPGAFADVNNWAQGEGNCGPTGNKPCDIEVSDGSSLSAMLTGKTNAQVLAINPDSRRD